MNYKLYAVRVFCIQWSACLAFYRDIVGWPVHYLDENLGWAQFALGGADMALERCEADDPVHPGSAVEADVVGREHEVDAGVGDRGESLALAVGRQREQVPRGADADLQRPPAEADAA